MCDLQFNPNPSFVVCHAMSRRGERWVNKNCPDRTEGMAGGFIIEHRCLEDIVLGARADGPVCEG